MSQLADKEKEADRNVASLTAELGKANSRIQQLNSQLRARPAGDVTPASATSELYKLKRERDHLRRRAAELENRLAAAQTRARKVREERRMAQEQLTRLNSGFCHATDLDRITDSARRDLLPNVDLPGGSSLDATLGLALSRTYLHMVGIDAEPGRTAYQAELFKQFAAGAGQADATYEVPPGSLTNRMRSLADTTTGDTEATNLTAQLIRMATPVFTRNQQLTSATATAVRLSASYLAAIADDQGNPDTANRCREIAAAITLLELRGTGARPARESIIISSDVVP